MVETAPHLSMTILTTAPLAHPEDAGVGVVEDVAISEMDPLEEVRETRPKIQNWTMSRPSMSKVLLNLSKHCSVRDRFAP